MCHFGSMRVCSQTGTRVSFACRAGFALPAGVGLVCPRSRVRFARKAGLLVLFESSGQESWSHGLQMWQSRLVRAS